MADIDTLTTLAEGMQVDENSEDTALAQIEATGAALQVSIGLLQAQAAANPNLQPVIAMLTAQKAQSDARLAKMQSDAASGTTLEGSLPQPAAAATPAPVTGAPAAADPTATSPAPPTPAS